MDSSVFDKLYKTKLLDFMEELDNQSDKKISIFWRLSMVFL